MLAAFVATPALRHYVAMLSLPLMLFRQYAICHALRQVTLFLICLMPLCRLRLLKMPLFAINTCCLRRCRQRCRHALIAATSHIDTPYAAFMLICRWRQLPLADVAFRYYYIATARQVMMPAFRC